MAHAPSAFPPSPDFVREFGQSMPAAYRKTNDADAIAEHAGVALRRGDALANIELVKSNDKHAMLCVVADDRPGLLATISAAFVLSGLDVIDAEAHTRRTSGGRAEAVDLFWVRHADSEERGDPVTTEHARDVKRVLLELLEGKLDASRATKPPEAGVSETIVRFLESADGALSTLEVETDDRSGLLLALSHALFQQKVQIVESEVRTVDRRVFDRFHITELDGKPINAARRLEIQVAVLSALGPPAPAAGGKSKTQGRISRG